MTQVQARRDELLLALAADTTSPSTRADIEAALAGLEPMLTGDLDRVPHVVYRDLGRWLEASKHLGIHASAPETAAPAEPELDGEAADRAVTTADSASSST